MLNGRRSRGDSLTVKDTGKSVTGVCSVDGVLRAEHVIVRGHRLRN